MIVIFKSSVCGDVIMFGDVAARLLKIMGKDAEAKGIITVEQLPDAIARLRAAAMADKNARAEAMNDESEPGDDEARRNQISLAQRAVPLLELLELSLKKSKPVVWGV